jgi:tetratricopeptide (TPR) repeat protein
MRPFAFALFVACASAGGLVVPEASQQPADDPAIRAAVERFFATQEAEDTAAYLALWSTQAQRPSPGQLRFIFDAGDDKYTDITLRRVVQNGERVRVRVSAVRERTIARAPPGPGAVRVSAMTVGLTFVRENAEWKLLREATPADDLAGALIDASSAGERAELLASEPELVGAALLHALAQRASQAAQRQMYAQAETLFNLVIDVARKTEDRAAEGEALQNLANTFYFRGRYADALAAYAQRLSVERERQDDEAIAAALLGIATVRYAFAEYGAALTAYREALALHEGVADEPSIATTLISTGNVLYLQGEYDAAIADYRRSLTLSRKTFNVDAEARALEGLGRVLTAQGDLAAALAAFSAVLADAKARNDRGRQATALQHLGDIQFKLGNLDEARASFEASRVHHEARNDPENVGRLWQAIALTDLVAGRFALAEKEYTTSIGICGGASDDECVARATVGLAFAQSAQEKYTQAIAAYRTAIELFTAQDHREDAARAEVGSTQAFAGNGDLDAALSAAGRARRSAVAIGAEDVRWRALVAEARVLRRKGDQAALVAAGSAVAAVEQLQRIATERPGQAAPADGDAAFATLAVIQAESGDAAAAFATAEQMRHYRLRSTLAPHERDMARAMTAEERAEERAAAAQLVSVGAQLARERSLPKPDPARIERLEKLQAEAIARRATEQQRLFERLPELRSWRGLGRPAGPDDLKRVLTDAGAVLLAFVADEDDLLTLVAARGETGVSLRAYVAPVSRRVLAERVNALLQPAVLRSRTDWVRLAGEFLATLPSQATTILSGASNAIIMPDAALWRLPFEAVPTADGYVGERTSLVYSSSLTAALQARETPPPAGPRPLLAVASPEISPPVRERVLSIAPGWTLRAGEVGLAELARIGPPETSPDVVDGPLVLVGADATEARVRDGAADAQRLHLASPFRVNAASPLFSSVLLGGDAAAASDDGVLEAREIMNLDLGATVAVLSDGSALAMRDAGRALDAVEWCWRSAGVQSVLLARWITDATASDALLAEFHTRMAGGGRVGDALRAARAQIRATPPGDAPFYWAGWLLIARQPDPALPAR